MDEAGALPEFEPPMVARRRMGWTGSAEAMTMRSTAAIDDGWLLSSFDGRIAAVCGADLEPSREVEFALSPPSSMETAIPAVGSSADGSFVVRVCWPSIEVVGPNGAATILDVPLGDPSGGGGIMFDGPRTFLTVIPPAGDPMDDHEVVRVDLDADRPVMTTIARVPTFGEFQFLGRVGDRIAIGASEGQHGRRTVLVGPTGEVEVVPVGGIGDASEAGGWFVTSGSPVRVGEWADVGQTERVPITGPDWGYLDALVVDADHLVLHELSDGTCTLIRRRPLEAVSLVRLPEGTQPCTVRAGQMLLTAGAVAMVVDLGGLLG